LCYSHEYARDVLNHPVSTKHLATLFEMEERVVHRNLLQGRQEPGRLSNHNKLDAQSEAVVVAMLLNALHDGQPMSKKQSLQIVREQHRKTTTRGWVTAYISRHLDALQTCRSIPQKDTRWAVPRSQLEEHINTLKADLTEKCAGLVSNLDELGSAEWEDRTIKKVIASDAVPKEDVDHSVSRRPRHSTFLACLPAVGDAMTTE
jgi:hypothetical protein